MSKFEQVVKAFQAYHNKNGNFPPAFNVDASGKPLLSWRVHLLPFIGEEQLYRLFHLDEPWDSEHNKTLINQVPYDYRPGETLVQRKKESRTRFVVPTGPGMAFEGKDVLKISDFTDGTSNTIMVVEVAASEAVIWTKPDDLIVDVDMPHRNLTRSQGDVFLVGFADGMTHALKENITADILKALFTRKGGEVIPPNSF